jgi:hypothetical protein
VRYSNAQCLSAPTPVNTDCWWNWLVSWHQQHHHKLSWLFGGRKLLMNLFGASDAQVDLQTSRRMVRLLLGFGTWAWGPVLGSARSVALRLLVVLYTYRVDAVFWCSQLLLSALLPFPLLLQVAPKQAGGDSTVSRTLLHSHSEHSDNSGSEHSEHRQHHHNHRHSSDSNSGSFSGSGDSSRSLLHSHSEHSSESGSEHSEHRHHHHNHHHSSSGSGDSSRSLLQSHSEHSGASGSEQAQAPPPQPSPQQRQQQWRR